MNSIKCFIAIILTAASCISFSAVKYKVTKNANSYIKTACPAAFTVVKNYVKGNGIASIGLLSELKNELRDIGVTEPDTKAFIQNVNVIAEELLNEPIAARTASIISKATSKHPVLVCTASKDCTVYESEPLTEEMSEISMRLSIGGLKLEDSQTFKPSLFLPPKLDLYVTTVQMLYLKEFDLMNAENPAGKMGELIGQFFREISMLATYELVIDWVAENARLLLSKQAPDALFSSYARLEEQNVVLDKTFFFAVLIGHKTLLWRMSEAAYLKGLAQVFPDQAKELHQQINERANIFEQIAMHFFARYISKEQAKHMKFKLTEKNFFRTITNFVMEMEKTVEGNPTRSAFSAN